VATPEPALDLAAQRGVALKARHRVEAFAGWRLIAAGPIIALFTVIAAMVATDWADVSFRDPDHVAALYVLEVGAGVALLVWLDILLRARRLTGTRWPSRQAQATVRRERWTARRVGAVAAALVSFYVTYLAYRNLKAVVPLLRPGDLFDSQLADLDQILFLGNDPIVLLHGLLGTGISAHVLSTFYVAFIVFLPLSLGLALVFSERLQVSLFYATALSINWLLGAATYFLLPALGPVYVDGPTFASLPHTEVTHLQQLLLDQRVGFLADPATGTPQAIAAFASLHIAMSFTALLAAYMLRLGRRVKQALWIWLALTFIGTVYLGWHYVVDDLAGLAIGAAALVLAYLVTGFDPRPRPKEHAEEGA
jgi:membrane-associated phospholipid phosphatase